MVPVPALIIPTDKPMESIIRRLLQDEMRRRFPVRHGLPYACETAQRAFIVISTEGRNLMKLKTKARSLPSVEMTNGAEL
jgi:hypothetical protein